MDGTYVYGFLTSGPIPNGISPGCDMIIVARALCYQAITPVNIPPTESHWAVFASLYVIIQLSNGHILWVCYELHRLWKIIIMGGSFETADIDFCNRHGQQREISRPPLFLINFWRWPRECVNGFCINQSYLTGQKSVDGSYYICFLGF